MLDLEALGSLCVRDFGLCCKRSALPLRSAAQHRGVTPIHTQVFGLAAKAFQDLRQDPDVAQRLTSKPQVATGQGVASPQTYTRPGPGPWAARHAPTAPLLQVSTLENCSW